MRDIKTRHSQKFIDADLRVWAFLFKWMPAWSGTAMSYRSVSRLSGFSRSRIKRMCRDWPDRAIVLDGLITANQKRWLTKA